MKRTSNFEEKYYSNIKMEIETEVLISGMVSLFVYEYEGIKFFFLILNVIH